MTTAMKYSDAPFTVLSPNVTYTDSHITSSFTYEDVLVEETPEGTTLKPTQEKLTFQTERAIPKLGVMLVGWGGNNGTTTTAGILGNMHKLTWMTKEGEKTVDGYLGSVTQASTVRIGNDAEGNGIYVPLKNLLPMVNPNDLCIGGWDISSQSIGDGMRRACVLDYNLQEKLYPMMKDMVPLPGVYVPDFIAANQGERADNVLEGTRQEQMEHVRQDIREFKAINGLDKVIVLWTANTERFATIEEGINDTADNLLASIKRNESEVSPSTMYAVAACLEGCTYINGSPQNTFVPGMMELAERQGTFIGGDDFKSGQTKMKSVLVDFLVSAGIKPVSIVSYNHLGNNDGKNLSAPQTFRSKEISKSNVVDDMVASNRVLFSENEHPDHVVVIKYVPYVGDSKRALDEYTSEIFLGGTNTIAMHNTCEDSLLATPLIYDLVLLAELLERIKVKREGGEFEGFHTVMSTLSYLIKAPLVPPGTPVINALFAQRSCICNMFRACLGLAPENYMMLEHKVPSMIGERVAAAASAHESASGPTRKRMKVS